MKKKMATKISNRKYDENITPIDKGTKFRLNGDTSRLDNSNENLDLIDSSNICPLKDENSSSNPIDLKIESSNIPDAANPNPSAPVKNCCKRFSKSKRRS